jgi:uncharacterized protein (DUF427 family)
LSPAASTKRDPAIAEGTGVARVDGNVRFPPGLLNRAFCRPTGRTISCGGSGIATYFPMGNESGFAGNAVRPYHNAVPVAANVRGDAAFYPIVTVKR